MERLLEMDAQLLLWLKEGLACPFLDRVMIGISTLGNAGLCWIALGIVLLCLGFRNPIRRRQGWTLLLCLGADALLCNVLLKPLVGRTRPYDLLGYDILIPPLDDPSFPSGHTAASFAAATAIYAFDKRWGAAAYVFAAVMGLSRVYLGVHFPTDVLAGAVLGTAAAKVVLALLRRRWDKTSDF